MGDEDFLKLKGVKNMSAPSNAKRGEKRGDVPFRFISRIRKAEKTAKGDCI